MILEIFMFLLLCKVTEAKHYKYGSNSNSAHKEYYSLEKRREWVYDIFGGHEKLKYPLRNPSLSSLSDSSSSQASSSSSSSESLEENPNFSPSPHHTISTAPTTPKTPSSSCNTDYMTLYKTFEKPEYINVQTDGSITARCADPGAAFVALSSDAALLTPFPENPQNEVEIAFTCTQDTGKYCVKGFETCDSVTEIGCCITKCLPLTLLHSGTTGDLNTEETKFDFDRFPAACPLGRITCQMVTSSSANIMINDQPVINSGSQTYQDLICDNASGKWLYDGQPVISAGCNVVAPRTTGAGCNANTLILTESDGRIPVLQFTTDRSTIAFCTFDQPNPLGLLRFNNGALLPSTSLVNQASYLLVCQPDNTSWGYTDVKGVTTIITEISCKPSTSFPS